MGLLLSVLYTSMNTCILWMESVLDGPEESRSSVIPSFHFEALTSSYFNLINAVSCLINRHLISPPPKSHGDHFLGHPPLNQCLNLHSPLCYCLVQICPSTGVFGYLLSKRVDIGIDRPQTFTTVDVFRYIYDTYNSKQVYKLTYKEILLMF